MYATRDTQQAWVLYRYPIGWTLHQKWDFIRPNSFLLQHREIFCCPSMSPLQLPLIQKVWNVYDFVNILFTSQIV